MKADCPYEIVDVFSAEPFAGNPLAVVRTDSPLSPDVMQKIAREMNLSETAFYAPRKDGDGAWRVRIFTPSKELAFAGHPILGAAWVIRRNEENGAGAIRLALDVGPIHVAFETDAEQGEVAWFCAPPMAFGAIRDREQVATALGLTPQDMDRDFPPREVSGGVTLILAPVRTVEAVRRAGLDLTRFQPLAAAGAPPMVYVFCRTDDDAASQRLRARFFFESFGVREDPASGNAAAFLGAYLLNYDYFGPAPVMARIEQGEEMGRPSLVMLRAARNGAGIDVQVGGQVVLTARGRLV
ncbi:PhzF family phenazine biosynthesis protein [Rhodoblastus sp.]|uniref:PhzF family phenazine biosynthesis protein n=1 Tax=Rhodoblastus sp. TaxID=1962975 RepID=UPI0026069124|nr:PhzF family phenazine biosynthesis protein [Rhodoblastus sp.]